MIHPVPRTVFLAGMLLVSFISQAATITVNTLSDTGFVDGDGLCALREAIDNANLDSDNTGGDCIAGNAADVIEFSVTGTLSLNGTQFPVITDTLGVSGPGAEQLTLDAGGQSRIFSINESAVVIQDLTMTGGAGGNGLRVDTDFRGGAILIDGGELSLTDLVLTDNHTSEDGAPGGAVAAVDAELGIFDSLFNNNSTSGGDSGGGAVHHLANTEAGVRALNIRGSRFSANQTSGSFSPGGAVYHAGAERVDIISSQFVDNRTVASNAQGGAVSLSGPGTVRVEDSRYEQNQTQGFESGGGALVVHVGSNLIIERSHFINNRTTSAFANGGAVYCSGGELDLELQFEDSSFINNRTQGDAARGGAIYCNGQEAPVLIRHSLLQGNLTEGNGATGGGISTIGEFYVVNSRIDNNLTLGMTSAGGGIYSQGFMVVTDSVLTGNNTEGEMSPGGAIATDSSSSSVTRSSFADNSTQDDQSPGGALYMTGGPATIRTSTFSANQTQGSQSGGGAVSVDSGLTLVNSTLSGNIANSSPGGGLAIVGDSANVLHTSFVDNEAGGSGGAVLVIGQLMLNNSLLAGNSPDNCEITSAGGFNPPSGNNLADDDSCAAAAQVNADIDDSDFLDVLADNGGPTLTHALLAGSPAIDDAGLTACADGLVMQMDQRGAPRPQSADGDCDVGAFEFGHQVLETVNESDDSADAGVNDTDVLALAFALNKRFPAGDDVELGHFVFRQCLDNTLKASDIDRLALWRDGGDGAFDAGTGDDVLIDDDAAGAGPNGSFFFDSPEAGAGLADVVDNTAPESRYYVSLDIDGNLFAMNSGAPGWGQTAYAAGSAAEYKPIAAASVCALLLIALFGLLMSMRDKPPVRLRMLLLAGFTVAALTACPGGGGSNDDDDDNPVPSPGEAVFCLSLLEIEARSTADNDIVPVAGLPVHGSLVSVSE